VTDIGNSLREARIRKGLTIKDVESATKIRAKYLEALEEDDFEVLPGPTYVKAFLRTYAAYLKLDADALVGEYRGGYEPRSDDQLVARSELTQERRSPTSAERKRKRTRRHQRGYALVGAIAVVVVALLAWFGSGRGQDAASLDASNISSPSSTVSLADVSSTTITSEEGSLGSAGTGTADTGTTVGASTTETTAGNGGGVVPGDNVTLVVSVTEGSCWLVVREDGPDGAELYAGTLSAGSRESFEGSKRYFMTVGAPEVLVLAINGTSHTLEEPAGSFIVTEAGVERTQ
jgi:cytoskeletal protein RodZ